MASSIESLIFEIITKDRASEGLSKAGLAAKDAAGNVDVLSRRLEEVGRKSATARVALAGNREAEASLDKIDARLVSLDRRTASPNLKVEGAARAIAEISALDLELDKVGGKDGKAGSAGAAAGALESLSGAGGMGAVIGAGVALSPVIATLGLGLGGLGLAAYSVTKNTAEMSKILAPLKTEFGQFSASLQPEVLSAFGTGVQIAGHLLKDIQPIAAATGKALDTVLGRIDAEFQSGQWKNFFGFMERTAGPDVKMLGDVFINLMNTLPGLLESLQPVAEMLLKTADAATAVTGAVGKLTTASTAQTVTQQALNAQHKTAITQIPILGTVVSNIVNHFTGADKAAQDWSASLAVTATAAVHAATQVEFLRQQVAALTSAENAAISPLLAYTNNLITQRNDADRLTVALKASHGQIGLNTAAQRASFSAAEQYIQDLVNTEKSAQGAGAGIRTQIGILAGGLPMLERAAGHNKALWQQISILKGWLDRLRAEKNISEGITILGHGKWVNQATGQVGGIGGHTMAAGGYVTGGIQGRDSVPILAMPGEVVVPTSLVSAGLVDHLRGLLPGFASGGVVGGYGGALRGLQPWGQHNMAATVAQITASIAGAMSQALTAAMTAGGTLSTSAGIRAEQLYALSLFPHFGWGAGQLPSLIALWNRESGWNPNARNPSSGAYGIPQALPPSKMGFLGNTWPGQVLWGENYIAGRYVTPAAAWAHETAFGWYGNGLDAVISSPTVLGVGERGPERVTVTPAGRGGGNTYNITITLPPGSDREQGRRIVGYIRSFEKSSGTGWRK